MGWETGVDLSLGKDLEGKKGDCRVWRGLTQTCGGMVGFEGFEGGWPKEAWGRKQRTGFLLCLHSAMQAWGHQSGGNRYLDHHLYHHWSSSWFVIKPTTWHLHTACFFSPWIVSPSPINEDDNSGAKIALQMMVLTVMMMMMMMMILRKHRTSLHRVTESKEKKDQNVNTINTK